MTLFHIKQSRLGDHFETGPEIGWKRPILVHTLNVHQVHNTLLIKTF
jgi:hypothetical protein